MLVGVIPQEKERSRQDCAQYVLNLCPAIAQGALGDGNDRMQSDRASFDHLVGAGKQRRWHHEAEHLRSLRIDDQLELVLFENWQLRRLGALKDAANIATGLAP